MNINTAIETALSKTIHAAVDRETVGWMEKIREFKPGRSIVNVSGAHYETPGRVITINGLIPRKNRNKEIYLESNIGRIIKADATGTNKSDAVSFRDTQDYIGFAWGCRAKYRERMFELNSIENLLARKNPIIDPGSPHYMNPTILEREDHRQHNEFSLLLADMHAYIPDLVEPKSGTPFPWLLTRQEFYKLAKMLTPMRYPSAKFLEFLYLKPEYYSHG